MKRFLLSISFTIFVTTLALADVPSPEKKSAGVTTSLSIRLDREATEAKLIIPRSQLKQLRAELDALDNGTDETAAAGVSRTQTIVGGAFLSLAMLFAGLWFVKPAKLSARNGNAVAVVIFSGFALATVAFGNAGPPAEARSITGKMFSEAVHIYGFGFGKIKLEVSGDVSNPTLIVPNPPGQRKTEE